MSESKAQRAAKNEPSIRAKGTRKAENPLFDILRSSKHSFTPETLKEMFGSVSKERVEALAKALSAYITTNLPKAIERRNGLSDYRTNPYVLMTTASVLQLGDTESFAKFLFHNKLYMGLETSFGKSIESALVGLYPIGARESARWSDPPEKVAEQIKLKGISREEKARRRVSSVWREIDKSCVLEKKRILTSIKSGPNCINDTQVAGMATAIAGNYRNWLESTTSRYKNVTELDVVIGITYGTDRTTNNKENQILIKLLENGFVEENREKSPGVLIDAESRSVRVYRRIGREFWSMIGNPNNPAKAKHVFLEVLIGLARALSMGLKSADVETRINLRMSALGDALKTMLLAPDSVPKWVKDEMSEDEMFWFHSAMTAFYDEGI